MMQPLPVIERFHKLHLVLLTVKNNNIIHEKGEPLWPAVPAVIKECCRKLYLCAILIPDNLIGRLYTDM